MNWFEKVLAVLDARMPIAGAYGWFHILSLVLTIVACVLVVVFRDKFTKKSNRIFLITLGAVLLLTEVYKQLNFSFNVATGQWGYQWYAFPFQFCSVPMYAMVLVGLTRGKFQEALMSFLATFGLLAGVIVMMYPGNVFTSIIGINIQTMMLHGGMVVVGVYALASGRVKLKSKTILQALSVFLIIIFIALLGNIVLYKTNVTQSLNMFFISPYLPCTLPVLSMIYTSVPYAIFLLSYVLGFTLGAYLMLLIGMLSAHINKKTFARKSANVQTKI